MTQEEQKFYSRGRLSAYCDDNAVLEPPCHCEIIWKIFDSYNNSKYIQRNPLEKWQEDFPFISNEDLVMLIDYFKIAIDYCENVCCTLAGIYNAPVLPETEQCKRDMESVVKACIKRYPWIKPKYIESLAYGVIAMCLR